MCVCVCVCVSLQLHCLNSDLELLGSLSFFFFSDFLSVLCLPDPPFPPLLSFLPLCVVLHCLSFFSFHIIQVSLFFFFKIDCSSFWVGIPALSVQSLLFSRAQLCYIYKKESHGYVTGLNTVNSSVTNDLWFSAIKS